MNEELTRSKTVEKKEEAPTFRKPNYKVTTEENGYRIEVDLPGVLKDNARITLDGNLLSVEAEPVRSSKKEWKEYRREIANGNFKLNLELNVDINAEQISAHTADGVLTVTLPLAEKAAKRVITIE